MRRGLVLCAAALAALLGGGGHAYAGCNPNRAPQDRFPQWGSPTHILFQRAEVSCAPPPESLFVTEADSGFTRRLWQPEQGLAGVNWTASGLASFELAGTTYLISAVSGRVSRSILRTWPLYWSPAGGRTAWSIGCCVFTGAVDAGDPRLIYQANSTVSSHPVWAPDGSRIAWTETEVGGNTRIWVANADGSELRAVTESVGTNDAISWSHDSQRLAFETNRRGDWDVATVNADGTDTHFLDSTRDDRYPAWSPAGERLAYISRAEAGSDDFNLVVTGAGGGVLAYDANPESNVSWSPNGKFIAFAAGHECLRWGIYVVRATGGPGRRLTNRCRFLGTAQADVLHGTPYRDFLYGLGGADTLYGGRGNDHLDGGAGRDRISCGPGRDTVVTDGRDRISRDCERVVRR